VRSEEFYANENSNDTICYRTSEKCNQQEEGSFYWHIGLEIQEESNEMLQLKHTFTWCWNWGVPSLRLETLGKTLNVVLDKDGEDEFDRSCEK
jgi:hypothetical protein